MLCQPPLHNKRNQPYTYRYPLPFGLPSHLGYNRALREFPVLYSMFPSVVHFIHSINNVYVSILVSQFLPPHPFPPWQPYIYPLSLCPFFFRFFSRIGYYRILSRVPCAIQQVLVDYLFYIQQCVYVNPKLLIIPPLTFPLW